MCNGTTVLAVGAIGTDFSTGVIYLLSFNASGNLTVAPEKITSATANGPNLANDDRFGRSIAHAGDLNGDDGTVLAVGARGDETGGSRSGAIYLLSFDAAGSLTATPTKIAHGTSNGPVLTDGYVFGASLASAGNLDGSGGRVLVVGGTGNTTKTNKTGELHFLSFSPPE